MVESGVSKTDRLIIYNAVRTGGGSAWENNKRERQAGLPRIIPLEYRVIPPNTTWAEYRQFLYNHNVRP
jgi:hypothetical protein